MIRPRWNTSSGTSIGPAAFLHGAVEREAGDVEGVGEVLGAAIDGDKAVAAGEHQGFHGRQPVGRASRPQGDEQLLQEEMIRRAQSLRCSGGMRNDGSDLLIVGNCRQFTRLLHQPLDLF